MSWPRRPAVGPTTPIWQGDAGCLIPFLTCRPGAVRGYLMNFAQGSQNAALMMSTVVVIMAVIALLFAALERVERRLMAWR